RGGKRRHRPGRRDFRAHRGRHPHQHPAAARDAYCRRHREGPPGPKLVSQVLQLRGPRALSEFRLAKLLASLQKIDPGVRSLTAEYRYFVEAGALGAAERVVLERLLDDGTPKLGAASGEMFLVVPRLGTVSPWSSKATDIAHNC